MTGSDQENAESKMPQGIFTRPQGEDELEVSRPPGMYYPIGVTIQWVTPGEGRAALNEMLAGILVLEQDHLARAVAAGETFRVDPLKELGDREGWVLESRLKTNPRSYSLKKDGSEKAHRGARLDLLLALEVMLRCALKPFEDQKEYPSWVTRSRQVYPLILKALGNAPLFEAKK
jgi:hypothetical protein